MRLEVEEMLLSKIGNTSTMKICEPRSLKPCPNWAVYLDINQAGISKIRSLSSLFTLATLATVTPHARLFGESLISIKGLNS